MLQDVLARKRDADSLRADMLKMRAEMAAHKPPKGPLDMKLLRGGLVDIEFCVHFLQLRDGEALTPRIDEALGQLPDLEASREPHALLTRCLVGTRLLAPDLAIPPEPSQEILARLCGADGFDDLLDRLTKARQSVAQRWAHLFDEPLELDE